eukprot:tig00000492_g1432.t1
MPAAASGTSSSRPLPPAPLAPPPYIAFEAPPGAGKSTLMAHIGAAAAAANCATQFRVLAEPLAIWKPWLEGIFAPAAAPMLLVTAFSDARLKEDIQPIEGALTKVEAMTGVTFRNRAAGEAGRRRMGLIAQEVQEVMPEAVLEHPDGYLSLAYGNLCLVTLHISTPPCIVVAAAGAGILFKPKKPLPAEDLVFVEASLRAHPPRKFAVRIDNARLEDIPASLWKALKDLAAHLHLVGETALHPSPEDRDDSSRILATLLSMQRQDLLTITMRSDVNWLPNPIRGCNPAVASRHYDDYARHVYG